MKISELINEEYENIYYEKTKQELMLYKDIIKDYIKHGTYIYRGMRNTGYLVKLDASKLNRTARNTHNYMSALTGYLPSWQGWPPRYKSIPMTTDKGTANAYGKAFVVIPLENQSIGLCMRDPDFWGNFPIMIDDLNSMFKSLFTIFLNYEPKLNKYYVDTLDDPKTILAMIDKILEIFDGFDTDKKMLLIDNDVSGYQARAFIKAIELYPGGYPESAIKWMDFLLDPNYGCKLVNGYKNIPLDFKNELWFSGKMLLINDKVFSELVSGDMDLDDNNDS